MNAPVVGSITTAHQMCSHPGLLQDVRTVNTTQPADKAMTLPAWQAGPAFSTPSICQSKQLARIDLEEAYLFAP